MSKPLVVLKIGTNVLTLKSGRINLNLIVDIVDQIQSLKDRYRFVMVSSGAVGTGKSLVDFSHIKDPLLRKQMLAAVGQGSLYAVYSGAFAASGVITALSLLTKNDFQVAEHCRSIKSTLLSLVNEGVLPILNENDVVSPCESSFGDNDQLCAITACLLEADQLIILSDISGFYTADPKQDPSATLIREINQITPELTEFCKNSMSSGGTGGMFSKLSAAAIATEAGIPTVIARGDAVDVVAGVLSGTFDATYFKPAALKRQRVRKIWMKNLAQKKGCLVIDAGAEQALRNNKSLLAVGVTAIEGEFRKGEVVLVKNQDGRHLAVGLAGLSGLDLRKADSENPAPKGKICIHKNHLYLL